MHKRWLMLMVALYLSGCSAQDDEVEESQPEVAVEEETDEAADAPSEPTEETEDTSESQETMTAESIVDAVEARAGENRNYFLETQVTTEYQDETQVTGTKEWYYTEDGRTFIRREVRTGDMPVQYFVSDGEQAWQYMEGDLVAYVSDMSTGDMMARPSLAVGKRLRSYRETHLMELEEAVEIAGHEGYHVAFTPKDGDVGMPLDVYLDVEHGLILKEVMVQDGHQMVYELVEFQSDVDHAPERYELELPEDVEVIDMSLPEHDTGLDGL
ncbi:LolA family protein [Salinicoccus roseus]|uniref:LolA family protein n=1 Tax=Salinicoccus roseus TaxID=45670 RepID=UPI0023002011|nr:hypothetical protein [Salinicoccus roseus]